MERAELAQILGRSPSESTGHAPPPRCIIESEPGAFIAAFSEAVASGGDILLGDPAVEVDGRGKYEQGNGVDVLLAEKRREDDLRATGLDFHRLLVEDLYAQPVHEMDRIAARYGR